eukprot:gene30970-41227_t
MILGYYGNVLRRETVEMLEQAKILSSTSRKAFWLLKSISHLSSIIDMIGNLKIINAVNILAIIEQCFLFLRFWFENIIFMSRLKLIVDVERESNPPARLCWVGSDSARFIVTILHLSDGIFRTYHRSLNSSSKSLCSNNCGQSFTAAISENGNSILSSIVAFLELSASAEYSGVWEGLIGCKIGEGNVGLCGVASSTLIIIDTYLHHYNNLKLL